MATSESERVTDYLCPIHKTRTMRRYGRISQGYIKCTIKGCDTLHVEDSPGFNLEKEGERI